MLKTPSLAAFPYRHNAFLKLFGIPVRQMQVHAIPSQRCHERRRRSSLVRDLFHDPAGNDCFETKGMLCQHLDERIINRLPPGSIGLGQIRFEIEG